jgi:hypothetical protein
LPNQKVLLFLIGFLVSASALSAQPSGPLPDAPQPAAELISSSDGTGAREPCQTADQTKLPGKPEPGKASSVDRASFEKRKWARSVDPGERVPRLSRRDKLNFWLHQEEQPWASVPAFISAGFGQLTQGDPKYGSDSGAFGERLGAAFIRQASMRFLSNSLIPYSNGEDPRYYRKAAGGYGSRGLWAIEQVGLTRRDNGEQAFNFSNIVGHLAASALTPLYYPRGSRSADTVLLTWGTSIAGSAGNNLFLEFWPDVENLWHRHRQRARSGTSGSG